MSTAGVARVVDGEGAARGALAALERERRVAVLRLEVMGRGDAMWRAAQARAAWATLLAPPAPMALRAAPSDHARTRAPCSSTFIR